MSGRNLRGIFPFLRLVLKVAPYRHLRKKLEQKLNDGVVEVKQEPHLAQTPGIPPAVPKALKGEKSLNLLCLN